MTTPGFSSRTASVTFHQFPQRDGAAVTDIAGLESPGWSNSDPTDNAPADIAPEVAPAPQVDPGFSNAAKTDAPTAEPVEHAPVTETAAEPAKQTAKKTTARKSAAQKKG